MKKTIQLLIACCLALFMLVSGAGGVSAVTAGSVWVDGIQMTDGDYLVANEATAVTAGATAEPVSYVAWYHNGTLILNDAKIVNGRTMKVCYGTGPCGVYADGDITVVLKGKNQIKNDVTEIRNGIVAQGDLTITSAEFGVLQISTLNFSFYSEEGDITVSGNPQLDTVNTNSDMLAKGAIFSNHGDVLIKDDVKIEALLENGSGDGFSAVVTAYNGNINVLDRVTLSVESFDYTGFGCGLCARDPDGSGKGNITISGSVDLYAMGINYGIYLHNTLSIGKNASVMVNGNQGSGIYGMKHLVITRGSLEVYGGSHGAFFKCENNIELHESNLSLAYYNQEIPLTTPSEFEKINYHQSDFGSEYIYDQDPTQIMHYFRYAPFHVCQGYTDYESWDWAAPYNCFVIENGIMGSVYNGSKFFDSKGTVTRGMVVTVMYRLADSPALTEGDYAAYNGKFGDVAKGQWYYDAVVWAYNNGVTEGVSENSFAPNQKTSREQIVTFFWRFCDYLNCDNSGDDVLGGYKDLNQVGDFAVDAFKWSVTSGIVNGTSETTLSPKDPCTRGQMAKIITYFALIFMEDGDWTNIGGLW